MATHTFTAKTFDQTCDLCRFFDEHPSGVWFDNSGLDVTIRGAGPLVESLKIEVEAILHPATPSNQTGLSGCGVHSFYVD